MVNTELQIILEKLKLDLENPAETEEDREQERMEEAFEYLTSLANRLRPTESAKQESGEHSTEEVTN